MTERKKHVEIEQKLDRKPSHFGLLFTNTQSQLEKYSVQFSLTTERLLGAVSRISLSISLLTSFIYTLVPFYHI